MYGAMWSEHCSYKSSKIHLRTLPTEGSAVLVGPGQDAGAVDVGDGVAVVFKMESHSHPSAIEPYQGAATGVGGIVRDIISMGARPVALLDPLMFGPLTDERNRWLLGGVVAGIGGYGNCIGVPTVGGEIHFAEPHSANPSINVMCVGIAPVGRADDVGVPHGARGLVAGAVRRVDRARRHRRRVRARQRHARGRRGRLASVRADRRPVRGQAVDRGVARDDRVAGCWKGCRTWARAGISCAVSESAARARMGADLDLDAVPLRERGLEAFEILTSESQERMLAVVAPERLADVRAVCEKWGLASAVIATLVPGDTLTIRHEGEVVAQLSASSLADDGPEYERPLAPDDVAETVDDPAFIPFEGDLREALVDVLSSPNIASKRWIFEQYDSFVQGQTVASAGSDAAVIRVPGTLKGLALSSDGKGRFGHLDPYLGAAHAVAEAARNVAATGAKPLAITNCMNFGNPERPVVMWQFAEAIRGMRDACLAFDTPVTGGNVSFYNESGDSAIWPTPVIGMLGLLEDYRLRVPTGFTRAGLSICVLGETFAELGGSEFADVVLGVISGRPPALDLERERALLDLLHEAANADLLAAAHDCGDGGLAVTLAEQAVLSGHGFVVTVPGDLPPHVALFSESASRAVVAVAPERVEELADLAAARGVPFATVGETGGPRVVFDGLFETTVHELRDVYEGAIPRLLGEDV